VKASRPAADVDAERPPREGLLEDSLAEVTGEEEAVGTPLSERGEEPQVSHAHVLRLVHYNVVVRSLGSCPEQVGELGEHPEFSKPALVGKTAADPLEDRPEDFTLLLWEARLPTEPAILGSLRISSSRRLRRARASMSEYVVSRTRASGFFLAKNTARCSATIVLPVPAEPEMRAGPL
jgi:hypothetical protein